MKQIIFITGASSGIGQALAKHYIENNHHVVMLARREDVLKNWCTQEAFAPQSYTIYTANVQDAAAMQAVGARCIKEVGVPDVVIAAAGISVGVETEIFNDIEVMRRIFETNNIGMMATFHPFISAMKEKGAGKLVGIASVAGIRGLAGHGAYCASKAGVISYCESLRLEMREATGTNGVQVLTLLPGYVATPLTEVNTYSMPFLLSATEFAKRAVKAIEKNKKYMVIPWQMGIVAKAMRLLPNALYDILFSGRARKARDRDVVEKEK